jgi:hypothetical protein
MRGVLLAIHYIPDGSEQLAEVPYKTVEGIDKLGVRL